jgi:cystathionine beta-synthase
MSDTHDPAAQPRHRTPYDDVIQMIGWTPLVRLNRVVDGCRTPVWGKCEFMNPGGSVKDRIGLAMIEAAERDGRLKPGGTIVEATSGNTGLALAMAAALKGYRCIFTMPDKMSLEKVKLLRAFGAEVVIVPTAVPPDHPDHYTMKAKSIVKATPNAILADQFYNPANPAAHAATTGPELWEQTGGRITHFFAGAGTGGTITGTARFLKERSPEVQICGVDPEGSLIAPFFNTGEMVDGNPYKVEGLGSDKIVDNLDLDLVDEYTEVSDGDAFRMARRLTREEGLFVGGSAGLIVHAAVQKAKELDDPEACVVAILCDWGERYLTKVFDDEWMRENGFVERRQRRSAGDLVSRKEGGAGVHAVEPTTSVQMALSTMASHDVSQLPVVRDGACLGSVSESDLMAGVLEDPALLDRSVESVMGAPYPVVDTSTDGEEVTRLLTHSAPAVLVRSDEHISGIVTRFDVVRDLAQSRG